MMFKYVYIQVGKILLKLMLGDYKGKREGRDMRCSTERAIVMELPLSSLYSVFVSASVSFYFSHTKLL